MEYVLTSIERSKLIAILKTLRNLVFDDMAINPEHLDHGYGICFYIECLTANSFNMVSTTLPKAVPVESITFGESTILRSYMIEHRPKRGLHYADRDHSAYFWPIRHRKPRVAWLEHRIRVESKKLRDGNTIYTPKKLLF